MMPLKPWPLSERSKIFNGICKLPYLNSDHKGEWRNWFDRITEVTFFILNAVTIC